MILEKNIKTITILLFVVPIFIQVSLYPENFRKLGDKALRKKQYCQSYEYYLSALNADSGLNNDYKFKTKLNEAKSLCFYTKGLRFLVGNDLDKAIYNFEEALKLNSNFKNAKKKLDETKIKKADLLFKKGSEIIENENITRPALLKAVSYFKESLKYNSDNAQIPVLLEQTQKKLAIIAEKIKILNRKVKNFTRFGISIKAAEIYEEIIQYDPDLQEIKRKLVDIYLARGRHFKQKNSYGNALIFYLKALNHSPENNKLAELVEDIKQYIYSDIRFGVYLIPADSKDENTLVIVNKLFSDLKKDIPVFMYLGKWEEIEKNKTTGMGEEDDLEQNTNVDQFVFVKIVDFNLIPTEIEKNAVKAFVSNRYKGEYGEERKEFGFWKYKVITQLIKASVLLNYRIVNPLNFEVILSENIKKTLEIRQEGIENPNPDIGLYENPVTIPAYEEIEKKLWGMAIDNLKNRLLSELRKINGEVHFFKAMEFKLKNNIEQAVEGFVRFIILDSRRESHRYKKAVNFLKEKNNFQSIGLLEKIGD